jgi:predicted Rossmann-fold nucleotide-binding protein
MTITKLVSGGQTGADRGGLDAAIYCDIPYGGWCPNGRKAEDGVIPKHYEGLLETKSVDYRSRTEANVVDSDATIVFTYGPPTGGSTLTVKYAKKHNRPCIAVDLDRPREQIVDSIGQWIEGLAQKDIVLNVAGSRESKALGIQHSVMVRIDLLP